MTKTQPSAFINILINTQNWPAFSRATKYWLNIEDIKKCVLAKHTDTALSVCSESLSVCSESAG